MGSNPVEALIFFSGFFLNWKLTAMIILQCHLEPQFKYELFHIYFTSFHSSREIIKLSIIVKWHCRTFLLIISFL